jgi:TatD DNase family protein
MFEQFIDTHAHLQEDVFDDDIDEVIKKIKQANVIKVLMPNTDEKNIDKMISIKQKYTDLLEMMIGIHPENIDINYKRQIKLIEKYLSKYKFIGIGEIGLDYKVSTIDHDIQKKFFIEELNIAKELNLPVSIHSRDSSEDMYKILKQEQNGNLKGVIHCFYDDLNTAKKLIDLGFYLGIGGFVTFKNPKLRDILKNIEPTNLVLETDSPYLTPTPYRGYRNDPSLIKYIATTVADVYIMNYEIICNIFVENSKKIFNI